MCRRSFGVIIAILFFNCIVSGQALFFSKSGKITFYSKSPLENIEASNKSATCVIDSKTGNMQFAVLMKGFEFKKARMQEHFNENYVESDKFPKSEFKGKIINNADINYTNDGSYDAKVTGKLTIHGQTKEVEADGKINVKDGKVSATSVFNILLSDFNIRIPKLVKDNISNNISIMVNCSLEPLKG